MLVAYEGSEKTARKDGVAISTQVLIKSLQGLQCDFIGTNNLVPSSFRTKKGAYYGIFPYKNGSKILVGKAEIKDAEGNVTGTEKAYLALNEFDLQQSAYKVFDTKSKTEDPKTLNCELRRKFTELIIEDNDFDTVMRKLKEAAKNWVWDYISYTAKKYNTETEDYTAIILIAKKKAE